MRKGFLKMALLCREQKDLPLGEYMKFMIPNSDDIIKTLSQPKVFDVELEMELKDADEVYSELYSSIGDYFNHHFHHYDSGKIVIKKEFEHLYKQPKIANKSIKINKTI